MNYRLFFTFLVLSLPCWFFSPRAVESLQVVDNPASVELSQNPIAINSSPISWQDGVNYYEFDAEVSKNMKVSFVTNPGNGYEWYVVDISPERKSEFSTESIPRHSQIEDKVEQDNIVVYHPTQAADSAEVASNDSYKFGVGGQYVKLYSEIIAKLPGKYYITYAYMRNFIPVKFREAIFKTIIVNAK